MRFLLLIAPACAALFLSSFKLGSQCDDVPALNHQLVSFLRSHINQKVGRGECWDLAAAALNSVKAKWDNSYKFGREVNPEFECVYPGDVVQFTGVQVKYEKDGYIYEDIMEQHTAMVYAVRQKGSYIMAEQNTSAGGKKVALNPLELKNIVRGKVSIYRPVKE